MAERFTAKENAAGGPGWLVIDTKTNKEVAWVYDQSGAPRGVDKTRAILFAAMLNLVWK